MNKVLLSNKFMSGQVNELLVYLLTCALKNSSQKRSYVTLSFYYPVYKQLVNSILTKSSTQHKK